MNEHSRSPRGGIATTVKDLQLRTERMEQVLPTLATKQDLKAFATKEDLKAFATKEDLKAFATKEDLKAFATRDFVREEGERTRRHVDMRFEQLRDEMRIIAEGRQATQDQVERSRADHVALERRVTDLEDARRGRKPRP